MNEAERKATLAHLLELEESNDVGRHLVDAHGCTSLEGDLRDLDGVHVTEHRYEPVSPAGVHPSR